MSDYLMGGGFDKWLKEVGVSDAPLTRSGLSTALQFFHAHMPNLPRSLRIAFLKGMDLHKQVRTTELNPPTVVAAFRKCTEDPFKLFYTKAGTSVRTLGVNPATRQFQRFRVRTRVVVLESRCASARDTWTDPTQAVIAEGGGVQFIIPDSFRPLETIQ